jgi:cytochrome P450
MDSRVCEALPEYDDVSDSIFASDSHHLTVPHELHRQRRKPLETFFSRQSITRVETTIADKIRALDERLQAVAGTDTVIHIDHAFTALTGDIIGHVACGMTPGLLDDAEFSPKWYVLPC